jgi:hypothetical protein
MRRTLVVAGLCTAMGIFVGVGVTRALAQRHQQTHAVMWLSQFHLRQLTGATQRASCQNSTRDIDSLRHLQQELVAAFPSVYRDDAEFRTRADALASALALGTAPVALPGTDCAAVATRLKAVLAACDDCHREYR